MAAPSASPRSSSATSREPYGIRVVEWLLFGWLSAVITLALVPVFLFMLALKLADCIDAHCLNEPD